MPANVVKTKRDERLWTKAKEIAQNKARGDDYAYIMGIYKRMKGGDLGKSIVVASRRDHTRTYGGDPHRAMFQRKLDAIVQKKPKRLTLEGWLAEGSLPVYTAESVVSPFRFETTKERSWATLLADWARLPQIQFHQEIQKKLMNDREHPTVRRVLMRRAQQFWEKKNGGNLVIKSSGPYIGPRGGKWADPQHKIPWTEKHSAADEKQDDDGSADEPQTRVVGYDAKGQPLNLATDASKKERYAIAKKKVEGYKEVLKGLTRRHLGVWAALNDAGKIVIMNNKAIGLSLLGLNPAENEKLAREAVPLLRDLFKRGLVTVEKQSSGASILSPDSVWGAVHKDTDVVRDKQWAIKQYGQKASGKYTGSFRPRPENTIVAKSISGKKAVLVKDMDNEWVPACFAQPTDRLEKAMFIGPRGGKWADAAHTIPYDPKTHGKAKIIITDKTKPSKPKKTKKIHVIDRTSKEFAEKVKAKKTQKLSAPKPKSKDKPLKVGDKIDGDLVVVQVAKPGKGFKIPPPPKPEPVVEKKPSLKVGTKVDDELVVVREAKPAKGHKIPPPPKDLAPPPVQEKSKEKTKELAVEQGEHIWGSRADLAMTADQLDDLSPAEQAKQVTKKKLMAVNTVDELLDREMTPEGIMLRLAVEATVAAKAADNLKSRKDYMQGIDVLSRSLDAAKTGQDVEDILMEWRNWMNSYERAGVHTPAEVEKIKLDYMKAHNIQLSMPPAKREALQQEHRDLGHKVHAIRVAGEARTNPEYAASMDRMNELRKILTQSRNETPSTFQVMRWKYADRVQLEYKDWDAKKKDRSVVVYAPSPDKERENKYRDMATALGKNFLTLARTGGRYMMGRKKPPKKFLDALRAQMAMAGKTPEEKEKLLRELTKTKARKKGQRKKPEWTRDVPSTVVRTGGKAVPPANPEELAQTFGFKNLQFGNWVSDSDARTHIEGAHGALLDLAEILGVAPEQISMKGELSLGIGSRGAGSARAHYELDGQIINITKIAGGGTMAHEWGHFLDNIVSKMGDPKSTKSQQFLSQGHVEGVDSKVADAVGLIMQAIHTGFPDPKAIERDKRLSELLKKKKQMEHRMDYMEQVELGKLFRQRNKEYAKRGKSQFLQDSEAMTQSNQSYWTRPQEMFARAFEAFIEDSLASRNRKSTYLVSGTKGGPYPKGKEREALNGAFLNLLKALKETHTLQKALSFIVDLRKSQARKMDRPGATQLVTRRGVTRPVTRHEAVGKKQTAVYVGPKGGRYSDPERKHSLKEKPTSISGKKENLEAKSIADKLSRKAGGALKEIMSGPKHTEHVISGKLKRTPFAERFGEQALKDLRRHGLIALEGVSGGRRYSITGKGRDVLQALYLGRNIRLLRSQQLVADLRKAAARGGSYYRRIPRKDGKGYDYIYKKDDYHKREDAHMSGEDNQDAHLTTKVVDCVTKVGDKGSKAKVFKELIERYGAKRLSKIVRAAVSSGKLIFKNKSKKFYPAKTDTSPEKVDKKPEKK